MTVKPKHKKPYVAGDHIDKRAGKFARKVRRKRLKTIK